MWIYIHLDANLWWAGDRSQKNETESQSQKDHQKIPKCLQIKQYILRNKWAKEETTIGLRRFGLWKYKITKLIKTQLKQCLGGKQVRNANSAKIKKKVVDLTGSPSKLLGILVTVNVTLFRNSVFADAIKLRRGHSGLRWALMQYDWWPYKEETGRHGWDTKRKTMWQWGQIGVMQL